MNVRRSLLPVALITTVSGGLWLGDQASAQRPELQRPDLQPRMQTPAQADERVSLFDQRQESLHPSEDYVRRRMTPQELRTARAIYRANQRVARLEHNLWIGHEPLRPRWNAVPMMSSRYTNPKFYVPVYIYNR
jgi:hypothetical protein